MNAYLKKRNYITKNLLSICIILIVILIITFGIFIRYIMNKAQNQINETFQKLDSQNSIQELDGKKAFDYTLLDAEEREEVESYRKKLVETVIKDMKGKARGFVTTPFCNYDKLDNSIIINGNEITISEINKLTNDTHIHIELNMRDDDQEEDESSLTINLKDFYDVYINNSLFTTVKIREYDDYTLYDGSIPGLYDNSVLFYFEMECTNGELVPGIIHVIVE